MRKGLFSLQVIPGTHHKYLGENEISCIVGNCIPVECTLHLSGAILFDPLILKKIPEQLKKVKNRFVMIEFV